MFVVVHQPPAGSLRQHCILQSCGRNDKGKASFRATHLETRSRQRQCAVIAKCAGIPA